MLKDKFGNELKEKHFLQIELQTPLIVGHIVAISEGGIATIGGQRGPKDQHNVQVTMAEITVRCDIRLLINPAETDSFMQATRIHAPNEESLHEGDEQKSSGKGKIKLAN